MSKIINNLFISVVLLFQLSGCGNPGGDESGSGGSSISALPSGNGSALLTWMPPTENTDSSTIVDLEGYKIYYGTASGNYSEFVDLNNPGTSSFLVENLGAGEWYFVLTAYNTSGIESGYSREVSTVVVPG